VSANVIFSINYHRDIPYLAKIYYSKGLQMFLACAQVTVTEFQETEAYPSLDPYKAKYSVTRLSKVGENMLLCELAQVISLYVYKANRLDDEKEVYN
jgi:hypothetical protein